MISFSKLPPEAQPIPNAASEFMFRVREKLGAWVTARGSLSEGRDPDTLFHPRAVAALAQLDQALALLASKTGPRADSTRASLQGQRDNLAAAVAHVDSIGPRYDGPLAAELIQRLAATRAACMAAYEAKEAATRSTVDAALLEIERCLADAREVDRDIAAAVEALRVPKLPNDLASAYRAAETSTLALAAKPGKRPSVLDQHMALDQGRDAQPAEAQFWICFSPAEPHALIELRAARFEARGT